LPFGPSQPTPIPRYRIVNGHPELLTLTPTGGTAIG
jgi:hypothetical protein